LEKLGHDYNIQINCDNAMGTIYRAILTLEWRSIIETKLNAVH